MRMGECVLVCVYWMTCPLRSSLSPHRSPTAGTHLISLDLSHTHTLFTCLILLPLTHAYTHTHTSQSTNTVYEDGRVCISILHPPGEDRYNEQESADERWRPILGVESIIVSVISMLSDPNDESPANIDAAVRVCVSVSVCVCQCVCGYVCLSSPCSRTPTTSPRPRRCVPVSVCGHTPHTHSDTHTHTHSSLHKHDRCNGATTRRASRSACGRSCASPRRTSNKRQPTHPPTCPALAFRLCFLSQ